MPGRGILLRFNEIPLSLLNNNETWGAESAFDSSRGTEWSSTGDRNDAFIEVTVTTDSGKVLGRLGCPMPIKPIALRSISQPAPFAWLSLGLWHARWCDEQLASLLDLRWLSLLKWQSPFLYKAREEIVASNAIGQWFGGWIVGDWCIIGIRVIEQI